MLIQPDISCVNYIEHTLEAVAARIAVNIYVTLRPAGDDGPRNVEDTHFTNSNQIQPWEKHLYKLRSEIGNIGPIQNWCHPWTNIGRAMPFKCIARW